MIKKLLCKLLGHNWGEWEYIADDSCEQVRVCARDNYQEKRQAPHAFGAWEYIADDSCEQVRVCARDNYQEKRQAPHAFGAWEYIADDSCEQVRVCARCKQTERKVEHCWNEWHEIARCVEKRCCDRCKECEIKETHSWAGPRWNCWDYDHDWFEMYCTKCDLSGPGNPWYDAEHSNDTQSQE
jgi:hypothetical protein